MLAGTDRVYIITSIWLPNTQSAEFEPGGGILSAKFLVKLPSHRCIDPYNEYIDLTYAQASSERSLALRIPALREFSRTHLGTRI
jgi:hypothetical protein